MSDLTIRSRAEAQRDIAVAALEPILAAAISAAEDIEDNADPRLLVIGIRNRAETALAKIAEIGAAPAEGEKLRRIIATVERIADWLGDNPPWLVKELRAALEEARS